MRDFRDVICPAAWKNPSSVCGHVALFPVLPEIFFGFPAFRGRNFGRDFLAGRGKMVAGFIFSSSVCHKTGRFLGNSCPPVGKKWSFSRNSCPPVGKKMAIFGKFPSSCWQKMAIFGKFFSFVCHKIGRFWEILVLLLAKNGDSWKIFVLFGGRNGFFQAFFPVP
ncbi:hypothetical protein [Phocaeicola sp.]|uniref:hypothetical protein n=1 Tax=Phocaeicola sp. TaxID=2773926 RepID=UPI002844EDC1|nr:hypothetical protein [Phocaeicola sp.]MDR3795658.1 hypothetical protein [Phocaeicola sp.]